MIFPFPSHYHRNHEYVYWNEMSKDPSLHFRYLKWVINEILNVKLLRFGCCLFLQHNLAYPDWYHQWKKSCFLSLYENQGSKQSSPRESWKQLIEAIIFWFNVFFLVKLLFSMYAFQLLYQIKIAWGIFYLCFVLYLSSIFIEMIFLLGDFKTFVGVF